MRVSIVTPSYNQASFIEQTIQSVLKQTHSDIEYIIIDGESNDGSVEIIKKYEKHLAYWHSRKDDGPADAINQGWRMASGDILSYLNSDDLLMENTVETIVNAFQQNPDASVCYGDSIVIDDSGQFLREFPSKNFDIRSIFQTWESPIRQPSTFLRKENLQLFGGLNETYRFCFDFEYWLRIASKKKFLHIPVVLSAIRIHSESITSRMEHVQPAELFRIFEEQKESDLFRASGATFEEAEKGLYLSSTKHFENSNKKLDAFRNYMRYCRHAFGPVEGAYRLSRYMARLLFRV